MFAVETFIPNIRKRHLMLNPGPQYQMRANGIPYVNKTADTEIVVDLWEITPEMLVRVDRLEGYDPNNHDDSWYKRELIKVNVNNKVYDAWLYFNNGGTEVVKSGDYKNYRNG